jgi:hypothetical protein
MRIFANLYLSLFLVTGVLFLAGLIFPQALSGDLFSVIGPFVVSLTFLFTVFLYVALGIDRRLSKRIFLPLSLYFFWSYFGFWPLSTIAGREYWLFFAVAFHVLLGIICMLWLDKCKGQSLLLRRPIFRLRSTLFFFGGTILALPLVLVLVGFSMAHIILEKNTGGFIRISPVGLYTGERVYQRGDQVIRLIGMIHIGQEYYYRDIADSLGAEMIVLAEGVTDRDNLLQHPLDFKRLGSAFGVVSQNELEFAGKFISSTDLERSSRTDANQGIPHILNADIDVNHFNPFTVEFLNVLGKSMSSGASLLEEYQTYNAWADNKLTAESMQIIQRDIFDRRNEEVLRNLDLALKKYKMIIVPWGAMHMPDIERSVVEKGFSLVGTHERLSLNLWKIPYAKLLTTYGGVTD